MKQLVDKKKLWHEEDDTIQKEIEEARSDYEKYDLDSFKGIFHKSNGIPAEGPLDQGRNCPRCAGRLELKEITKENENVFLYCKSCGLQVFAEDIDYRDPIPDALYRKVPDSVILYWENFRKERNKDKTP